MQGGLTVWNRQADAWWRSPPRSQTWPWGQEDAGALQRRFVGGHVTDDGKAFGGTLRVTKLTTGEIHTDGGIADGTPDLISGGVFVISGAIVESVTNDGSVTTLGQNDMVLDNWGEVQTWTAHKPITSYGASAIGFVNFSDIGTLEVRAPIQTFCGSPGMIVGEVMRALVRVGV